MKKAIKKAEGGYVTEKTFERHMQSIARSFADNAEVMALILKEIKAIHEDHKDFRLSIGNLYSENLSRDKTIDNLDVRVKNLELRSK